MFTDIKGFSERTSSTSREGLVDLLNRHDELLLPVVRQFGGEVVKTIGDALLATFESPTNAVLAGLIMQERLRKFNEATNSDQQLHVRVAINTGEVEERNADIFGEAVNIASRIENIAEPGEVYFTESVYLAMNKAEVPTSSVGRFRLKGIPEQIQVYRVLRDPENEQYQALLTRLESTKKHLGRAAARRLANQQAARANPNWRRLLLVSVIVVILSVAGLIGYFWYTQPSNVQLRQARTLFEQGQIDESAGQYKLLLEAQINSGADNWVLHGEIVERFGYLPGRPAKPIAQQALMAWLPTLRKQGSALTATQAHTLLDVLLASVPFNKTAEKLRQELVAESSLLQERLVTLLDHRNPIKRLHAKLALAEMKRLTAEQERGYHWRNVVQLPYGHQRELLAAAEFFGSNSPALSQPLTEGQIKELSAAPFLRSSGATSEKLLRALKQAFGQQLTPVLKEWQLDSQQPVRAELSRRIGAQ